MKFLNRHKVFITWLNLLILTNLLTGFLFGSGWLVFPNTVVLQNSSQEFLFELEKINALDKLINHKYVEEINNQALGETLINSMFSFLGDPYSEYYSAEKYAELMESINGSFGGIGVSIDGSDPNNLIITEVISDSPAEAAGIKEGDVIIKVNNEDIVGQGVETVVEKTRGEIGTDVELTVLRDGQEQTFTLTRDTIDTQSIHSSMLDGVGYISISTFGSKTTEQFETAVNDLLEQGATSLIIDLRNNGGGLVNSAVEIADLLLDADQVGYAVSNGDRRQYFTTEDGKFDIPFVVLVNQNTASASELLSGSLQKSGATIIGMNTYGKGVIQQIAKLPDGTGYKLTTQEYYLKDDSKVNKVGIKPDIVVENSYDDNTQTFVDNQLNEALEYLKNPN